ncbi:hypothetical protein E2C01_046191 [Portunus trituberculatus]|uniref:Uncharacterized protein n=1 Tax=Portunus trituberculatus TaxID=210409 RepID=A0A5B7G3Q6_PORTR|nr:hypothetical protein [Portunus trituberculatus]
MCGRSRQTPQPTPVRRESLLARGTPPDARGVYVNKNWRKEEVMARGISFVVTSVCLVIEPWLSRVQQTARHRATEPARGHCRRCVGVMRC